MSPFHKVDVVVLLGSLVAGSVVACLAIVYGRDLVGVAATLASLLGPVGVAYGVNRSSEWKARAADQSSMVDQENGKA